MITAQDFINMQKTLSKSDFLNKKLDEHLKCLMHDIEKNCILDNFGIIEAWNKEEYLFFKDELKRRSFKVAEKNWLSSFFFSLSSLPFYSNSYFISFSWN